ncbi:unnamed protein product [Discosporangium mesarthrocarpum]
MTLCVPSRGAEGEEAGLERESERWVLSEVHMGKKGTDIGCSKGHGGVVISRFRYQVPSHGDREEDSNTGSEESDTDDEIGSASAMKRRRVESRRSQNSCRSSFPSHEALTIVHCMETPLSLVGQQVWSAAFLLGDFILTHETTFRGRKQVMELGAGPGLAGLVASRVASLCYLTDYHEKVLDILSRNAEANRHLCQGTGCECTSASVLQLPAGGIVTPITTQTCLAPGHGLAPSNEGGGVGGTEAAVMIRRLDWTSPPAIDGGSNSIRGSRHSTTGGGGANSITGIRIVSGGGSGDRYAWRPGELEALVSPYPPLEHGEAGGAQLVLLASDVIYDEDLTESLFDLLRELMYPPLLPLRPPPLPLLPRPVSGSGGVAPHNTTITPTTTPCRSRETPREPDGVDKRTGPPVSGPEDEVQGVRRGGEVLLFMALEKRFNFTLEDLSVVATGYKAFLRNVCDVSDGQGGEGRCQHTAGKRQQSGHDFEGRKLPLDFAQCFHYHRSQAMELWEIRRRQAEQADA